MTGFVIIFALLVVITLLLQLITKMKIVGADELAIVAGQGKSFSSVRGGRVFVFPLIHRFYRMDMRPRTTSVRVESAIAAGIVPLTVVATVSFAVASSGEGLRNAIRRILLMTRDWNELTGIATGIIEGHLRDSIATMTPEEVMTDKDRLVQNMIRVCKADLAGIGLEITAMNIADVDDHRLEGVREPELYIALLKRIQSANAEAQSRAAQAQARAAAKEESETRRAEVAVRDAANAKESLTAQTRVDVAQQGQRSAIGVQRAQRDAEANVAGIKAQIRAEEQRIAMLREKFRAEILVPAEAERERMALQAKTSAAEIRGRAQAEIDQVDAHHRDPARRRQGGARRLRDRALRQVHRAVRRDRVVVPGRAYRGNLRGRRHARADLRRAPAPDRGGKGAHHPAGPRRHLHRRRSGAGAGRDRPVGHRASAPIAPPDGHREPVADARAPGTAAGPAPSGAFDRTAAPRRQLSQGRRPRNERFGRARRRHLPRSESCGRPRHSRVAPHGRPNARCRRRWVRPYPSSWAKRVK